MKEKQKFDKWIGLLSVLVVLIVAIVFSIVISDTHIAKGTYGATNCTCPSGYTLTAAYKCLKQNTNSVSCTQNATVGDGCATYRSQGYTCTVVHATAQGATYSCSKTVQEVIDATCVTTTPTKIKALTTTAGTHKCANSNGYDDKATCESQTGKVCSQGSGSYVTCYYPGTATPTKTKTKTPTPSGTSDECWGAGDLYSSPYLNHGCECGPEVGSGAGCHWVYSCKYSTQSQCESATGYVCGSEKIGPFLNKVICMVPTSATVTKPKTTTPAKCLSQTECAKEAASANGCNGASYTGCTNPISGTQCYTYTCIGSPSAEKKDCYCGWCNTSTNKWEVTNNGLKDEYTCNRGCSGGTPGWGFIPSTKQCGNVTDPTPEITGMCYCNTCKDNVWIYSTLGMMSESTCKSSSTSCSGTKTWGEKKAGSCGGGSPSNNTPTKTPTSGGGTSTKTPTKTPTDIMGTPSKRPSVVGPTTQEPQNPQTGASSIMIVWLIAVVTIVYSAWYFKRSSNS